MRRLSAIFLCLLLPMGVASAAAAVTTPGMSLFGDLKYGPDFPHFDYVNPDAPKGGTVRYSAIGTFDTLNPFVVKGVPAAGIGDDFRYLDRAFGRRARERIWPRRRDHRTRPGQAVGALHDPQGGAVSRRHADDAGGCRLDLRDLARQGAADVPLLLRRCHEGRKRRRARRPVHVQIRGKPRIAADHRRDAGTLQGVLVGPRFHQDDARSAARQRPLQDRSRSIPGARSPIAGSPTIGAPICRSTRGATMSM